MTTIVVVLIGIGVVFIASSLDCTPIRETFNAIVTNQSVDWTGTKNCTSDIPQTPTQGAPATIGAGTQRRLHDPNPDGSCPQGTTRVTVSGGKIQCEDNGQSSTLLPQQPFVHCPPGYVFNSSLNKCVKQGSTPITGGRGV